MRYGGEKKNRFGVKCRVSWMYEGNEVVVEEMEGNEEERKVLESFLMNWEKVINLGSVKYFKYKGEGVNYLGIE